MHLASSCIVSSPTGSLALFRWRPGCNPSATKRSKHELSDQECQSCSSGTEQSRSCVQAPFYTESYRDKWGSIHRLYGAAGLASWFCATLIHSVWDLPQPAPFVEPSPRRRVTNHRHNETTMETLNSPKKLSPASGYVLTEPPRAETR